MNPEAGGDSGLTKIANSKIDTVYQHVFPLILNGEVFDIELSGDTFCMLKRPEQDTIIKAENFYSHLEVLDINKDGLEDLRIFIFSNTANQCESYLFDDSAKTYVKIQNSQLNFEKLKSTDLYFEYDARGCADYDWESTLFTLEKYALIPIGRISGKGCLAREQKIEIYKTNSNDKEVLLETLPYRKNIPEFGDKWDFILNYWSRNHHRFTKASTGIQSKESTK